MIPSPLLPPTAEPRPTFRALPPTTGPESAWQRWICLILGLALAVGFFVFLLRYHAPGPGNPGIDENAYLVAGKNFAHHFQIGLKPSTPYAYIGPMWVRADSGWYYPKYPLGVPVLNGIAIWLGGGHNNFAAGYVSLVCAALAVLGMYLLARRLAGSFAGLLAAVALATNATLLHLALVPSSHAPAVVFVVWGMFFLLRWWQTGGLYSGIAAGFFLGAAVSMRYSEGLLVVPLAVAAVTTIRWKQWRSYLRSAVPLLAWLVPVGGLFLFNRATMGTWTGYDPTNESEGFGLKWFGDKWESTIQQLHMYGLFLLLPVGLLGMLLMLMGRAWRAGLLMLLWFVPGVLLYTAYYWNTGGIGYLRFFLTMYPAVIASAAWLLVTAGRAIASAAGDAVPPSSAGIFTRRLGLAAAMIVFIAMPASAGIYTSLPDLRRQKASNGNMVYSGRKFLEAVPEAKHRSGRKSPLLIAEGGSGFGFGGGGVMFLQFVGDGEWYTTESFSTRGAGGRFMGGGRGGGPGPAPGGGNAAQETDPQPVLFDPERRAELDKAYRGKTSEDLAKEETRVLGEALRDGRGVYAIVTSSASLRNRLEARGFSCEKIASWKEPPNPLATDTSPAAGQGGRFFGGRGGPAPGAPGGRGGPSGRGGGAGLTPPGMNFARGVNPQSWEVVKITLKTPAPDPATLPATLPATR